MTITIMAPRSGHRMMMVMTISLLSHHHPHLYKSVSVKVYFLARFSLGPPVCGGRPRAGMVGMACVCGQTHIAPHVDNERTRCYHSHVTNDPLPCLTFDVRVCASRGRNVGCVVMCRVVWPFTYTTGE